MARQLPPCAVFRVLPTLALALALAVLAPAAPTQAAGSGTNVTTYHYDNLRTGWDQTETQLTPATVGSGGFALLHQVALDEQVDAQPLFVSQVKIAGGVHDVVYVATENNTIYAIDADTGAVLVKRHYGVPVPQSALPGQCVNNSVVVGIDSTPVIDLASSTLYAIMYTYDNGSKQYFGLHALDLATLAPKAPPVEVTATNTFRNGRTVRFSAANERQRPALLESNGTIYAGFGSFCDMNANVSRGWVLGWHAGTMAPLAANRLTDRFAQSPNDFFLSSIWMAGYGIASDDRNGIFFATSNSDTSGKSYSGAYNIEESVVNQSADLTTQQSAFTPAGGADGFAALDSGDSDLGAGGVLLLPPQPGAYPNLAVAAGKRGPMYLLNRASLGGIGGPKVTLGAYRNDGCWCGPAYFTGSDGIGRVVTSSGHNIISWRLRTSPKTELVMENISRDLNTAQDPGFFTAISSNGTKHNSAVVWAVTRPSTVNGNAYGLYLAAFDPANNLQPLFYGQAGTWAYPGVADSDAVPVIANGQVFVASYKMLSIFGIKPAGAANTNFRPAELPAPALLADAPHEVFGTVMALHPGGLTLRTRTGAALSVDIADAAKAYHVARPVVGKPSLIRGDYNANGVLVAKSVLHAKDMPLLWPADH
jgi:outer membrane protein assembly factor BamB